MSWSPYYQIRVDNFDPILGREAGFAVDVNNQFLLTGMNLSSGYVPSARVVPVIRAAHAYLKSYYDFPFQLRPPGRVLWVRLSVPALFALLGASLVFQFLLPVSSWVGAPGATTTLIAALYLGIPIVLASSIFATTFQRAALGTAALASNLVGSVLGGLSEYSSLAVGLEH